MPRHIASSWPKLVGRLADRRRKVKARRPGVSRSRTLQMEMLEPRQLLATFSLTGTAGNDTFDVVIGSPNHQVRVNGGGWTDVAVAEYDSIVVSESGGSDAITITGATTMERAQIEPDSGFFRDNRTATPEYRVDWSGISRVTLHGNGATDGSDAVFIYDTAGDDTFTFDAASMQGEFVGAGGAVHHTVDGIYFVHAYATAGGHDRGIFVGSAADQTFKRVYDPYNNCLSTIAQPGSFFSRTLNYESVEMSGGGGADVLNVTGKSADETAVVEPMYGRFVEATAKAYANEWTGIPDVTIDGNGGYDRAYLFHSPTPASDTLTEGDGWTRLAYSDGSYNEVTAFNRVRVDSQLAAGFDDIDLLDAVRASLGLPATTILTADHMLQLTSLTADSALIDSLDGLQSATNLDSLVLIPADLAGRGELGDLSPLAGLSSLTSVTLQGLGLEDSDLAPLGSLTSLEFLDLSYNNLVATSLPASFSNLTALEQLDLRYNQIDVVPAAVAALPDLASLSVYGNPLTDAPRTGLANLAGKLVGIDLVPDHPDRANSIADLAAALYKLPIEMYEYLVNTIEFQPYAGAMKGPLAVLQTKAGNDWDTASLLVAMFAEAGITGLQYTTSQIVVPIQSAMDWLGVQTPMAAYNVLLEAGCRPVLKKDNGSGQLVDLLPGQAAAAEYLAYDHVWLEKDMTFPGVGTQTVRLDPSWKFRDYQPGLLDLTSGLGFDLASYPEFLGVDFDEYDYLSQPGRQLACEYYEDQVLEFLAGLEAPRDGFSLADVAYDGPILPQVIATLPTSPPYGHDTVTHQASIPNTYRHRIRISLSVPQSGKTVSGVYNAPEETGSGLILLRRRGGFGNMRACQGARELQREGTSTR